MKRPRICIIPVIDVSPSMQGEKLAYAKRSVEKLIDHLSPNDYCGLVQFSYKAEVLQKPVKVTSAAKDDLKRKVNNLQLGNATNIADAILVSCDLANKMDLPGEVITRVILFTDGQANQGPAIKRPEIVKLAEANLGLATMSAFGYGSDADQGLLAEVAKLANGNYAYVQNPDDALTAFGKELGGLLSTYATGIELNVSALAGHTISSVVSDVEAEEEKIGGDLTIKVPELLIEEVRDIVLAVKLKAQVAHGQRAVNVFEVKGGYDILDATHHKERKAAEAKTKTQFVPAGEEDKEPNADLDKAVGLAQIVRAQIEAEEQAKRGDFHGAQVRMQNAADSVRRRGLHGLHKLASNVGSRLQSSSHYADGASYLASARSGGTRGYGLTSSDAEAAQDLGHVGVQMSNSVQTSTSNAFAGNGVAVPLVGAPLGVGVGSIDLSAPVQSVLGVSPMVSHQGLYVSPPLPPTNSAEPEKAKPAKKIKQSKSPSRW